mmetsp:Transcript_37692/g.43051  ORF Transcript_37692/g.43051 Transcript_37692/m.43051 type:complete len:239 (+) Transcript_37692:73-789(+)
MVSLSTALSILLVGTTSAFTTTPNNSRNNILTNTAPISTITKKSPSVIVLSAEGFGGNDVEEDNNEVLPVDSETLAAKFERAVVLQRLGEITPALQEYQLFIKAAAGVPDLPDERYAEVYNNVGQIYIKLRNLDQAKVAYKKALIHRELGTALVNLALINLEEMKEYMSQLNLTNAEDIMAKPKQLLSDADDYIQRVIAIGDDDKDNREAYENAMKLDLHIETLTRKVFDQGSTTTKE